MADMGCFAGPNDLLAVSEIIDTISTTSQKSNSSPPSLQVFLNDLPGNDFNTIFRSLQSFYRKWETEKGNTFGNCFNYIRSAWVILWEALPLQFYALCSFFLCSYVDLRG
uniref:Uncharacterized protein n=1 Tax=Fagus sylvatica TaxID=28930 RepID=A0A2N9FDW0_FAGSY